MTKSLCRNTKGVSYIPLFSSFAQCTQDRQQTAGVITCLQLL